MGAPFGEERRPQVVGAGRTPQRIDRRRGAREDRAGLRIAGVGREQVQRATGLFDRTAENQHSSVGVRGSRHEPQGPVGALVTAVLQETTVPGFARPRVEPAARADGNEAPG